MANKSGIDVTQRRREQARIRWEALRRNDNYRAEYKHLFRAVFDPEISSADAKTAEDWGRYFKYEDEFNQKYGKEPCVSKKDLKEIRRIASNPMKQFNHGNGYIVMLCELWGIRYPKNPDEDFKPRKDYSLFLNNRIVYVTDLPVEAEAHGVSWALFMMEFFLKKRPLVTEANGEVTRWSEDWACEKDRLRFDGVADWLRNEIQEIEKIGQKKRDAGYMTFYVNVNNPKDVILAEIKQFLDRYQKRRVKQRWRPPDMRSFKAWDLKQEKLSDSEIANSIGYTQPRSIGKWRAQVKKIIEAAEATRNAHRDKDGNFVF